MRMKQRHKLVTKLSTTEEMRFSDPTPIAIWLRVPNTKWRKVRCKRGPSIMWQKLRYEKIRMAFGEETVRKIEDQNTGRETGWDEISTVLTGAAKRVCGE